MGATTVWAAAADARRSTYDSWSATGGIVNARGPVIDTSPGAAFSVVTATVMTPLPVFTASNRLTASTRSCDCCLRLAYSQPADDAANATTRPALNNTLHACATVIVCPSGRSGSRGRSREGSGRGRNGDPRWGTGTPRQ